MENPKKQYYKLQEAANILGVKYHTLWQAVKTGAVKAKVEVILKNKKFLIPHEEVTRLLKEKNMHDDNK